jgi:hypothetical protein
MTIVRAPSENAWSPKPHNQKCGDQGQGYSPNDPELSGSSFSETQTPVSKEMTLHAVKKHHPESLLQDLR